MAFPRNNFLLISALVIVFLSDEVTAIPNIHRGLRNSKGIPTEQQSIEQFKGQARLPHFAVPRRYDIFLKPDLSSDKFYGSVEITVDVVSDTRFLVLNAADLAVDDASVWFYGGGSSQNLQPSGITAVEKDEILVIQFDQVLPYGEGVLGLRFEGTLTDGHSGFLKRVYKHNGENKTMAVANFESTDARRCFPCWDEPAFKATFKMTLEVPFDHVALSNMPIIKEEVNGNVKKLFYQESVLMSTYLVAVVVGLFDFIEAFTIDGIKVRVYCPIGKSSQGKFALDVAVKTLDLYKGYFEVPYALPKLDMVIIPDFPDVAMDNYGLVVYNENILYDEHNSMPGEKLEDAILIEHELAHQWFSSLVTMEWWTDVWLNEGFATWVSYLVEDSLFPEWKRTFFIFQTASGLELDASPKSHPVELDINYASEMWEFFDAITHSKGASLLRMLQSFLGHECFQKSLVSYIKRFAFSNAKTEDLWNVLEEESGEPLKMLMNSWTKQRGYPVVRVSIRDGKLELEQSIFLANGSSGAGQWIVPITLCVGSYATQKKILLKTKYEEIDMSQLDSSNAYNQQKGDRFWIKFNVDQTGFYRVKYDGELETGIRNAVESNKLSITDRFGILDDSYAFWKASKQNMSSLLSLMSAYREEPEYIVLKHLIKVSYKVVYMIADAKPELSEDIKQFIISLLQHAAERVGWDKKKGESYLDEMLREKILSSLAQFGHSITQDEGLKRFNAFLNDRDTTLLPPDTRYAAYVAVMRTVDKSNRDGYESLLKIFKETDLDQEKNKILSCLASSPDPDIVLDALNFIHSSEVRNEDAFEIIEGISREGRNVAWKWFKENWDFISKKRDCAIQSFICFTVPLFSSDAMGDEIEQFFASRVTPEIFKTLKRSLEQVKNNANLVKSIRNDGSLAEIIKELAYKKY